MEQKMIPFSAKVSLNVVATETESITASTATFESLFCSSKEIPSFSKDLIAFSELERNNISKIGNLLFYILD